MVEGPNSREDAARRQESERGARTVAAGGRRSPRSPGEALQPELAPPPPSMPRRHRPILSTASGILSFLGIAALAAFILFYLALEKIGAPGPLPADKVVYIEPGTDTGGVVEQLEREGVIDNWSLMTGALWIKGDRQKIKAGEYQFKQNASLNDVIETLVSGKQILRSITLPEGLTSEQIVQRLTDDPALVGDVRTVPKDGTLMPETYKFARGFKREQMISRMQDRMKKVAEEVWTHRSADLPVKSPYEMMTLASIVEKETGKADERPRVAGVFINRLSRNIPLQSDPTIVYGLVGGKGTLGRGILKSELEQRTPYNTYTIVGLPPGPICNPGRAAMEAVANPSRTREIYFVADGTGGHAFAETLDQHRQNVARWRQIERDAKDKNTGETDKNTAAPVEALPLKQDQRGDNQPKVPVYGMLDDRFTGANRVTFTLPMMRDPDKDDYPIVLADEDRALTKLQPMLPPEGGTAMPVPADELGGVVGLEVPAASSPASAEEQGFDPPSARGPMVSFPVSAARRADEKAAAARFGVDAGSDRTSADTEMVSADPAAGTGLGARPPGKSRIVDASEGTLLDPLLNKTYDLNSPKTVPANIFGLVGPGASVH